VPEHEPEVIAAGRRHQPGHIALLYCPRCSYQYIHAGKRYETRDDNEDALHILFSCERCGDAAALELVIADCRGSVTVEWRGLP
jgi:hypothetical protein